jgi:succinate-semialdehyde dehydrogenase/glutarate-semialdehyde dehydrogenase
MPLESINPVTGEPIERFDEHTADQIDARLGVSYETFLAWRDTSFADRAKKVKALGAVVRRQAQSLGAIITREMGKPIAQSLMEIEKCAAVCDYYAENAAAFLAPEIIATDAHESSIRYAPIGPVLAVMPWNFPFWQVFRFAAPALMAGNVCVLKHASNVPRAALTIEKLFSDAGFPDGSFITLLIGSSKVAEVIADQRIAAVTLTGSESAGRAVASAAGRALKKSVLELGGSDPLIVLPDADLEKAAEAAVFSRTINSGQTCIAAKRWIVHRDVIEPFTALAIEKLKALKVGDPADDKTQVGPMAREDLRTDLHHQISRSVDQGATLALGGQIPAGPGYYYPVTLLTGVTESMVVAKEETFGPAAVIIEAETTEHAIAIANRSELGLGGSIWTGDLELGSHLSDRVETGSVFVNGMVKSDVRLPFGGTKNSGYGRELSAQGIREFTNIKTVWIGK